MNLKIYILLALVSLLETNALDSNNFGCGPAFINMNDGFKSIGLGKLTSCCTDHDLCYTECKSSQAECDSAFEKCLRNKCKEMNLFGMIFCQIATVNMAFTVKQAGSPFYCSD
jgi:hypothetical protein